MVNKKGKGNKGSKSEKEDVAVYTVEDSDSTNYAYDIAFDEAANYEMLQKHMKQYFEQQLLLLRTEFQGKVDSLHQVIKE